jgi:hypothetical protein
MPDSFGNTFTGDGAKRVASAGVPVQLSASARGIRKIDVTAATANTGVVVIGATTAIAAGASRRGTPLGPGDTWSQDFQDLTAIWIDAENSGDGVTFSFIG